MMKILTCAISTIDNGIVQISLGEDEVRYARKLSTEFLIVHQVRQDQAQYDEARAHWEKQGFRILHLDGAGLSRSRNVALQNALGKYVYLADDDIKVDWDVLVGLAHQALSEDFDILAFRVSQGGRDYKRYPAKEGSINLHNAAKLHSANFILRKDFIERTGITFRQDMGLGTDLPNGEEYVFIAELLKAGAKGYYKPIVAVEHPDVSSGQSFPRDIRDIRAKRVMLDRVFGRKALLYRIIFALRKAPLAVGRISLRDYFGELIWRSGA